MPATGPKSRRRERASKLPPEVLQAAVTLHRAGRLEPFLADNALRWQVARLTAEFIRSEVVPVVRTVARASKAEQFDTH